MTTSFPASPVAFLEAQRLASAKADGYSLFAVNPGDGVPGFVYSVGMCQADLPEVLYFYPKGMCSHAVTDVREICSRMIVGSQRLGRLDLLRQVVNGSAITASSGARVKFGMLTGDTLLHALRYYLTRAVRFRNELGLPRGVLIVQRPDVPTFGEIRDMECF